MVPYKSNTPSSSLNGGLSSFKADPVGDRCGQLPKNAETPANWNTTLQNGQQKLKPDECILFILIDITSLNNMNVINIYERYENEIK